MGISFLEGMAMGTNGRVDREFIFESSSTAGWHGRKEIVFVLRKVMEACLVRFVPSHSGLSTTIQAFSSDKVHEHAKTKCNH